MALIASGFASSQARRLACCSATRSGLAMAQALARATAAFLAAADLGMVDPLRSAPCAEPCVGPCGTTAAPRTPHVLVGVEHDGIVLVGSLHELRCLSKAPRERLLAASRIHQVPFRWRREVPVLQRLDAV